ncbi:hypothetical protein EXIGUO8H_20325 [Exiguobacterium sp. 8H]|uniref:hypothetical protein n=1 Tax=unclassified Exiguobacterium TaxID=2644629 RepID=UPI0012EEE5B4|nr:MULTISPECIES: hypothetical protein [unclassified Exiguobacterium]VXB51108.1 hypothetical protein EXIGUO8A_11393 [Exiguobacterium sp. 8A]VXB52080.1 hypothetical protein EXIGUO8H_20325 [Exiguobacterium sp. 8H]
MVSESLREQIINRYRDALEEWTWSPRDADDVENEVEQFEKLLLNYKTEEA